MTQRTGNTSKRPSFADVKSAALKNIDRVLAHWLPNGKRVDVLQGRAFYVGKAGAF